MNYEAKLASDNSVFDSSYDTHEVFSFQVNGGQVIKALDLAILKLKKGHKAKIICPPNLAYGDRGSPGVIPPNATLIYTVEIIDVQEGIQLSHILIKHNECSIPIDRFRNKKVTRTR